MSQISQQQTFRPTVADLARATLHVISATQVRLELTTRTLSVSDELAQLVQNPLPQQPLVRSEE